MLKLLKYEFRKGRDGMLALLGVILAAEIYFLIAYGRGSELHMALSVVLLVMMSFGAAVFVFIRGVNSYSQELRTRAGYMVFMLPIKTWKIVASKFLYTFVHGLLFFALITATAAGDILMIAARELGSLKVIKGAMVMLEMYGVYVGRIIAACVFVTGWVFLMLIATVALAYFAITLSHTLFRDRKWRWLPALLIFIVLAVIMFRVNGMFTSPLDGAVFLRTMEADTEAVFAQEMSFALDSAILPALIPSALVSLSVIVLSTIGCADMLKKRVSL